jgi:hypothetical protein
VIGEMLAGGGLVLAGAVAGRFTPGRRRHPKAIKPICGCTHHHSFHDQKTGQCHGKMRGDPLMYYASGTANEYKQIPCTCCQYSGPEPIPEIASSS